MTASLTPSLALAYLRELSADIRAAIVLDAAGNPLAGPEPLAAPPRALLAAAPRVSRGPAGSATPARRPRAPPRAGAGAARRRTARKRARRRRRGVRRARRAPRRR